MAQAAGATARLVAKPTANGLTANVGAAAIGRHWRDIPGPRPSLPFVGTAWHDRLSNIDRRREGDGLCVLHRAYETKLKRYGPIFKEEFQYGTPIVHLLTADNIAAMVDGVGRSSSRPLNEFVLKYRLANQNLYHGVGLTNATGKEWRALRGAVGPALLASQVQNHYLDLIREVCDDWVKYVDREAAASNGLIPDIHEVFYKFTLEAIFMLCFERKLGCFDGDPRAVELIDANRKMFQAFQQMYYGNTLWRYFETGPYRQYMEAEKAVYRITKECMKEFSVLEKPGAFIGNFLRHKRIVKEDVLLTIVDVIAGGIFTATQSLTFLIHQLAINPRVQSKLQQVVDANPHSAINEDYVDHCVHEAFRVAPTIPGLMRVCEAPSQVEGYQLPAGTVLFAHTAIAGRTEACTPNPLQFDPDRWSDKNFWAKKILLPFGFGSRSCVGKRFAHIELKQALVTCAQHFHVSSPLAVVPVKLEFLLIPAAAVPIVFRRRQPGDATESRRPLDLSLPPAIGNSEPARVRV